MIKNSLIIAVMAFVTLLQADYIIKYNMDGEGMEFMYKKINQQNSFSVNEQELLKSFFFKIDI
jgi:hypothetical protein